MSTGRLVALLALLAVPGSASASPFSRGVCAPTFADQTSTTRVEQVWNVRFDAPAAATVRLALAEPIFAADDAQGSPRAKAIEYSHAYGVRRKIHVVASIATLPLFVTEYVLGKKLYDGTGGESVRSAHGAVGAGIGVLFGVNTVTGVWNLWEGRQDPAHRGRRLAHGIMMLGADAGFVATGMLAPNREDPQQYLDRRSIHRTVALTSMAVATASYLMMLLWK